MHLSEINNDNKLKLGKPCMYNLNIWQQLSKISTIGGIFMKRSLLLLVFLLFSFSLIAFAVLDVAFVYVGPIGDHGWSYAHDLGRLHIEDVFGDAIRTAYIENVAEGAEAESAIRGYARRGFDLVFTTSFGFMDPTIRVAQDFPDTVFMHCSGYRTAENVGTYFGRMYEPRFLSGMLAGAMTTSNIIGYVAAFPIPEVVRGINAFALGVNYVNPNAKVHVIWTNTWFDPSLEREAAISILDLGADVIAQHQDTPAPQQAAEEWGVYSVGYNSDMTAFAPEAYLGGPIWNWGPYYEEVIRDVMAGEWETHEFWGGMDTGVVDLLVTDLVPLGVEKLVDVVKRTIVAGEFHPFVGPIYDQDGELRIEKGEVPTDGELLAMDWFVSNVVGRIPR